MEETVKSVADNQTSEPRHELCIRCTETDWDALATGISIALPEHLKIHGKLHQDGVFFLERPPLAPEICRICRLFAYSYSNVPGGPPQMLVPCNDDLRFPRYGFERRRLGDQLMYADAIQWILTDRDPNEVDAFAEYLQRQPMSVDWELVKSWIHRCNVEHSCRLGTYKDQTTRSNSIVGLKVIDCQTGEVIQAPERCEYVALSYVWGSSKSTSEDSSYEQNKLPLTIAHATLVTKKLGYRYLWIDRYCIDQTDETHKHVQISQMGEIYAAAELTIIASAGDSPDHGLPGVSAGTRSFDWRYEKVGNVYLIALPLPPVLDILNSKWASRGWTYQECFLSRRRLFFTKRNAVFICNGIDCIRSDSPDVCDKMLSKTGLEDFPLGQYPSKLFPRGNARIVMRMGGVEDYLDSYSHRDLSYDSDALNAISGILNMRVMNSENKQVHHITGLPFVEKHSESQPGILLAFGWFHDKPCRRRPNIPSWSSLGWDGGIEWWPSYNPYLSVPEEAQIRIQIGQRIFDIEKITTMPEIMAQLKEGKEQILLEITAYMVNLPLAIAYDADGHELAEPRLILAMDNEAAWIARIHWDLIPTRESCTEPVLALSFGEHSHTDSPFVNKVANKGASIIVRKQGDYHERVGLFSKDYEPNSRNSYFRSLTSPKAIDHDQQLALVEQLARRQRTEKRTILLA